MRTRIMFYTALIALTAMGAGCANESSVNAPETVAPAYVGAPDQDAIAVEFMERLATMKVNICRDNDRVLVILPPADDSRAVVCPVFGGTAH